jgi:hypothetical protein
MVLPVITPMSMLRDIKVLHIEATDVCQAACPLCKRVTDPDFNADDHCHLSVEQLCAAIDHQILQNLDKMFACGNYGDPAAGLYTLDLYRYLRSINPDITLGMNTNGGLRNQNWWTELAGILNQSHDYVVFSIDGLADTNHIYRRGVVWGKVIENAQAFISAGGSAHWDMLVYQHNQHQVDQAQQLAKDMGFTWFRAKVSKRPLVNELAYPDQWQSIRISTGPIKCRALEERSIYIDATGTVNPCCWLGENKTKNPANFDKIIESWTKNPHPICRATCTAQNNTTNFSGQWQREIEFLSKSCDKFTDGNTL